MDFYDPERDGLIWEIYGIFNREVICGLRCDFVLEAVCEFAKTAKDNVDVRMLSPLRSARGRKGILSVAWKPTIEAVLQEAGYSDVFGGDILGDALGYAVVNGLPGQMDFCLRLKGKRQNSFKAISLGVSDIGRRERFVLETVLMT